MCKLFTYLFISDLCQGDHLSKGRDLHAIKYADLAHEASENFRIFFRLLNTG